MDQLSYVAVPSRRRNRRRALVALLLGATVASVGAGASSLAYFTDTQANSGSWTSGSIKLGLDPATTVFTTTGNIMPGDSGSHDVTVSNAGSSALRYRLASTISAGGALAGALQLKISSGGCTGPQTGDVYSGSLAGATFGDFTASPKVGRTVSAAGSDDLCFAWSFPSTVTDNTLQGVTTTAQFSFYAEQVANNP